jgi:hypothetical protein
VSNGMDKAGSAREDVAEQGTGVAPMGTERVLGEDTLSVIERWWRIDFPGHSEWTNDSENAKDAHEYYDYPVAGPFVLEASATQGAVEALRQIVALDEREGDLAEGPGYWGAIGECADIARRGLGGQ